MCLVVRLSVGAATAVDNSHTVFMGPVGSDCGGVVSVVDSLGVLVSSDASDTGNTYALCVASSLETLRGCNIFLPVIVDLY